MKKSYIYFILMLCLPVSVFSQTGLDSLVNAIESKIDSNEYSIYYLPDSILQYGCETLIFYDSSGLYKLERGCGDVSIEMNRDHLYFRNNELVYMIGKRYYYNAPPNYTEEVARAEGGTSGWFDPKKTRVVQYQCYFSEGRMVRLIDNEGKDVSPESVPFEKTEHLLLGEAEQALRYYHWVMK